MTRMRHQQTNLSAAAAAAAAHVRFANSVPSTHRPPHRKDDASLEPAESLEFCYPTEAVADCAQVILTLPKYGTCTAPAEADALIRTSSIVGKGTVVTFERRQQCSLADNLFKFSTRCKCLQRKLTSPSSLALSQYREIACTLAETSCSYGDRTSCNLLLDGHEKRSMAAHHPS
jgi:hypothetical protein